MFALETRNIFSPLKQLLSPHSLMDLKMGLNQNYLKKKKLFFDQGMFAQPGLNFFCPIEIL